MASFCHQVLPFIENFFQLENAPHLLNFISDELQFDEFDAKCEEFFGLFVTFFFLAKMLGTFLNRLMVKEADSDKSHNP